MRGVEAQHGHIVAFAHHQIMAIHGAAAATTALQGHARRAVCRRLAAPHQLAITIVERDVGAGHRLAVIKTGDPHDGVAVRAGARVDIQIGDLHQARALRRVACLFALRLGARGAIGGAVEFHQPQSRFGQR